jgi:hypothetical protein
MGKDMALTFGTMLSAIATWTVAVSIVVAGTTIVVLQ